MFLDKTYRGGQVLKADVSEKLEVGKLHRFREFMIKNLIFFFITISFTKIHLLEHYKNCPREMILKCSYYVTFHEK